MCLSEERTLQWMLSRIGWPFCHSTRFSGMTLILVCQLQRTDSRVDGSVVDGCRDHSNDPGALQMDWLEVQLMEYRERGMQVWLTGHVPPHMGHYFDNCCKLNAASSGPADWKDLRYGDLALRYQDTIVGHLYGHM